MSDFWGHFWAAVQALGAIGGILAAWMLARTETKVRMASEADQRVRLMRAIAFRHQPEMFRLVDAARQAKNYANVNDNGLNTFDQINENLKGMTLPALNISDTAPLWALPDRTAKAFSELAYLISRYNSDVTESLQKLRKMDGLEIGDYRRRVTAAQDRILAHAEFVRDGFQEIIGI